MPTTIPFHVHGNCLVALVALQGQQDRVYHYSKTIGEERSWCLRDYLTSEILRFGFSNGSTASAIEALVTAAEAPEFCSVEHVPTWRQWCMAASARCFPAGVDATTANNSSMGQWRRMNKRGS
jgi:hypothetical protein